MPGAEPIVPEPGAPPVVVPPPVEPGAANPEGSFKSVDEAMEEIKKLRTENAKHRTKNKELDSKSGEAEATLKKLKTALGLEPEEKPEDKIEKLKKQNQQLEVELGITQLINDHQVPKDSQKYFRFLLAEKFEALKDNEELTEEQVAAVAQEARKIGAKPASNGTGVNSGAGGGGPPNPNAPAGAVTVEGFSKMSTSEKSILYTKDPALYQKLFNECVEKKLL